MNLRPQSLFSRTALLIGAALLLFAAIAWQAIIWSALGPSVDVAVYTLTQTAQTAMQARRAAAPAPAGTRFDAGPPPAPRLIRGLAFGAYIESVRSGLQQALKSPEVRVTRIAPSEIWVRLPEAPDAWLVLTWRVAGPKAPLAALSILAAAAVIVLTGAAFSARRLTASLATLAAAAARIAEGERVTLDVVGPSEVRALALAIQSMAHRLAEVDEQRELMLAGVSHDLRTPLARLRVALELLPPHDAALTTEMAANVEEMDHMLGQLLRYVRSSYQEQPTAAALDEVVREALRAYSNDARVSLLLQSAQTRSFAVECVRHCLLNLVQNALEYGRAPVAVRTALLPAQIEICVQDAGTGLDPEQWLRALRPFQRLLEQPGEGHSGLGLALVQRLVSTCGGTLHAQRVTAGFVVCLRLPCASGQAFDKT